MARKLDAEWLGSTFGDRHWVDKILAWRNHTLSKNEFVRDETSFLLNALGYSFRFHAKSSYSSIEVFEEIFKDDTHFLAPGFSGKDARVVCDIGANEGFYSMRLKQANPGCKIIAVEPNPFAFSILEENIRRNCINNVSLVAAALAAHAGELRLEVIPEITAIVGERIRIPERPWIKDEFVRVIDVPSITLDGLLEKHSLDGVDILKLDVEGLEYEILGASTMLDRIARIVVEYHGEDTRRRLITLLSRNGFDLILEDRSKSNSFCGDLYFFRDKGNQVRHPVEPR